ncbi:MAG: SMP-30/gluconolactonase/LRE family protein [Sulfitobacter sp.]
MSVLDATPCLLGEGPLWHPERGALFWFDILARKMMCHSADGVQSWVFDENHSAAGWVDHDTLLIASETGLWRFDLLSGDRTLVVALEADNAITRSNDGRADPWGGFWIGTMGKKAERGAGAIYRYFCGELRKLVPDVSISNAICFAPDRVCAYYTDTPTRRIMRQPLDNDGWPSGPAQVFVDLRKAGQNPDGAVTDAQGNLWVALWGAARVSCFDPQGHHLRDVPLPALQPTCPAFGGPDLCDLIVTSAANGLDADPDTHTPANGATYCFAGITQGLPEPKVIL